MKWFKHITDSIDDPFIYELIEEFGGDGYLVFFGTLEIYSREFSTEKDWKLVIKLKYLHQKLVISQSKIKKILSKIYKWEVNYLDEYVSIYIPKFKELLDESTIKKLRSNEKSFRNNSGTIPKNEPTDIDKDKDKESKEKNFTPPSIQEISQYCQSRNNGINPAHFFDFYTAKNWMIGKNKMKDWKAAVRTWETRSVDEKGVGASSW